MPKASPFPPYVGPCSDGIEAWVRRQIIGGIPRDESMPADRAMGMPPTQALLCSDRTSRACFSLLGLCPPPLKTHASNPAQCRLAKRRAGAAQSRAGDVDQVDVPLLRGTSPELHRVTLAGTGDAKGASHSPPVFFCHPLRWVDHRSCFGGLTTGRPPRWSIVRLYGST